MTLKEKLEAIGGCGDGNCHVHVRGGMHTNGGCRCFKQNDGIKAQRVIRAYKEEIQDLQDEICRLESINEVLRLTISDIYCR